MTSTRRLIPLTIAALVAAATAAVALAHSGGTDAAPVPLTTTPSPP